MTSNLNNRYFKEYLNSLFQAILSPVTISLELTIINSIILSVMSYYNNEYHYLILLIYPFLMYAPFLVVNGARFISLGLIYDNGIRTEKPYWVKTLVNITNFIVILIVIISLSLFFSDVYSKKGIISIVLSLMVLMHLIPLIYYTITNKEKW